MEYDKTKFVRPGIPKLNRDSVVRGVQAMCTEMSPSSFPSIADPCLLQDLLTLRGPFLRNEGRNLVGKDIDSLRRSSQEEFLYGSKMIHAALEDISDYELFREIMGIGRKPEELYKLPNLSEALSKGFPGIQMNELFTERIEDVGTVNPVFYDTILVYYLRLVAPEDERTRSLEILSSSGEEEIIEFLRLKSGMGMNLGHRLLGQSLSSLELEAGL